MNQINFLPGTVLQEHGRQVRVWRQSILIAAVALLIVAWAASSRARLVALDAQVAARREEAMALAEQATEMVRLQRKNNLLLRQVRVERQLALPVGQAGVIATLAQLMPAPLALTDLTITAPNPRPDQNAGTGDSGADSSVQPPLLQVQLAGVAPDDLQLADFVGCLTDHPLFSNVKMIFSRALDLGSRQARQFRIEMEVRLDHDYLSASAAKGVSDAPERDQVRTLLVLAALTILFILGFWLPATIREGQLRDELAGAEQKLAADRDGARGLARLARDVVDLQAGINQSEKFVPQDAQVADLLRQLSLDLESRQAIGQETQTRAIIPGRDYSVIPVTLRFRSSFAGVYGFLSQVESQRRLIRITRLELTGDARRPGEALAVRLDLSAFFAPPAPEADDP